MSDKFKEFIQVKKLREELKNDTSIQERYEDSVNQLFKDIRSWMESHGEEDYISIIEKLVSDKSNVTELTIKLGEKTSIRISPTHSIIADANIVYDISMYFLGEYRKTESAILKYPNDENWHIGRQDGFKKGVVLNKESFELLLMQKLTDIGEE